MKKLRSRTTKCSQTSGGYVALISSIIISAVLVSFMLDQSLGSFLARFSILDHEKKTTSFALALSCAEIGALALAQDEEYSGNETVSMGDGECEIDEAERDGGGVIFFTHAIYKNTRTDLEIKIDQQTQTMSWREL